MKSRILISISAITLLAALVIPTRMAAQDDRDVKHAKLITFDAPGAGTGEGQGTSPVGITPRGRSWDSTLTRAMCTTASCALPTAGSRRLTSRAGYRRGPGHLAHEPQLSGGDHGILH
jgi:hypothetical protein